MKPMSSKPWCGKYTYADISLALPVPLDEVEVRKASRRGEFDFRDFKSVVRWLLRQRLDQMSGKD